MGTSDPFFWIEDTLTRPVPHVPFAMPYMSYYRLTCRPLLCKLLNLRFQADSTLTRFRHFPIIFIAELCRAARYSQLPHLGTHNNAFFGQHWATPVQAAPYQPRGRRAAIPGEH